MSKEEKTARDSKVLRYAELMMRKARNDAKPEDLLEIDQIVIDLGRSKEQLLEEAQHLIKNSY